MLRNIFAVLALFTLFSTAALAVEVGDQAPCVNLDQLKADGSRANHSLCDRNSGTKFLLLDFFQTTCGACIANLPNLTRLSQEAQDTTTTRLIALDRNEQAVVNFVNNNQNLVKYEVPLDSSRLASKAYGIQFTPTTMVVDQSGKILYKHVGTWSDADYSHLSDLLDLK